MTLCVNDEIVALRITEVLIRQTETKIHLVYSSVCVCVYLIITGSQASAVPK